MKKDFLKKTIRIGAVGIPTWLMLTIVGSAAIIGIVILTMVTGIGTFEEVDAGFIVVDGDTADDVTLLSDGSNYQISMPLYPNMQNIQYTHVIQIVPTGAPLVVTLKDVKSNMNGISEFIVASSGDPPSYMVGTNAISVSTVGQDMTAMADGVGNFINMKISTNSATVGDTATFSFEISK